MRAQNRLNVFAARYVSVTSSKTSRFGFTERADPDPARRRALRARPRQAPAERRHAGTRRRRRLSVTLPEIEVAGPDVDLAAAREYGEGGVISALTNSPTSSSTRPTAGRAVADLRKQASAGMPMRLAREAARQAVERSFAMPLQAAGFDDAKVVATFPTDGTRDGSRITASVPYEQAIEEGRRRRAEEGRQ